jgi:hypothetical protein
MVAASPRNPDSAGLSRDSCSAQIHNKRDIRIIMALGLWNARRAGNQSKFKAGGIQNVCTVYI